MVDVAKREALRAAVEVLHRRHAKFERAEAVTVVAVDCPAVEREVAIFSFREPDGSPVPSLVAYAWTESRATLHGTRVDHRVILGDHVVTSPADAVRVALLLE